MPGLKDLLEKLRRQKQERMQRYDLGSSMDDIKKKLEDVIKTEREGVKQRMPEGQERTGREQKLDALPPDPAGQLRELQKYDFVDPEAKRKFEELLNSLRQQMMQPMFGAMQQALQGLTPQDLKAMREMMQDLNRMLRQKAEGEEPDFDAFKEKWGDRFPGVESLDQLIEQMGRQMAAMQSLMQSLSPEQRKQLDEMMRSLMLQDERLEAQMRQLAMNLSEFLPLDEMAQRYPVPGRRGGLAAGGHAPHGGDAAARRARARDPRRARPGGSRGRRSPAGRAAAGPGGGRGSAAAAGDDEAAGGSRLPAARGRRAVADRAGHPQDRRPGAARRLRRAQARSHRWPRHPASRRRRGPDRRDQGLRVRRSVPAGPQGNGDERPRAYRAGHARSASPRTTSRSTAPSSAPRRPPSSCST